MANGDNTALGVFTTVENLGLSAGKKEGSLRATLVGDADYNTTGTPGFLAAVRAKVGAGAQILGVDERGLNGGHRLIYDDVNDKLIAEVKATGVEVADGVSLAGITFAITVRYQ